MLITEAHKEDIQGTISCYDRIIIRGTAGKFGYAGGMTSFFYDCGYRIFDFANIFLPVTEAIKKNAAELARKNGVEIEYIRKPKAFRKDDKIAEILAGRGTQEGQVLLRLLLFALLTDFSHVAIVLHEPLTFFLQFHSCRNC